MLGVTVSSRFPSDIPNSFHNNDAAAVQSLLLLGCTGTVEDANVGSFPYCGRGKNFEPIVQLDLKKCNPVKGLTDWNAKQVPSSSSSGNINNHVLMPMIASSSNFDDGRKMAKKDHEEDPFTLDKQKSLQKCSEMLYPLLNGDCSNGQSGLNEDLSNALLSSSLVLGSLSKSKKCLKSEMNDQNSNLTSQNLSTLKRKRGVLLPPSSRVSSPSELRNNEVTPSVSSTASRKTEDPNSKTPALKVRKNSAERYRQRNHRRKQILGSKLIRFVELLKRYRAMMAAEVSKSYDKDIGKQSLFYVQDNYELVCLLLYFSYP